MGCLFSSSLFPVVDTDTASLQRRIRELEAQLGAQQNGVAGPASSAGRADVLFFPDPGMPCRYGASCRRPNCDYAHGATSLTRLIATLMTARRSLSVAVFSLTCDEIAQALLDLHRRGVKVRLLTDDEQVSSSGSDVASLRAAGIPVRHDGNRTRLLHHKFAVIDGSVLLTGSFNWTRSAVLQNDENVLVLRDAGVARTYERHFEEMWARYEASGRQPLPVVTQQQQTQTQQQGGGDNFGSRRGGGGGGRSNGR